MKNYEVLDELIPKTQDLHREIFDKGYIQGYQDALDAFVKEMKQSILKSGDWCGNQNRYWHMVLDTKDFLQEDID